MSGGTVSVVLVNYRGVEDTLTCLRHLQDLRYPRDLVQIICVDNASGDDSVARLRAESPEGTLVITAKTNTGFAGGCNLGVREAMGEFVAFINNDARPDTDWLAAAIPVLESDAGVGAVACKVLDWDGDALDYGAGSLAWYGMAYKPDAGQPYRGQYETERDVLYGTGSALIVRRDLFIDIGGFDEQFFMFYEDADLGWRMNLYGHRVRYVPSSVVFHRHHASIEKFGSYRERFLLERNALMMLYKNVEQHRLDRLLAPALALAIRRGFAIGDIEGSVFDLARGQHDDGSDSVTIPKDAAVGAYAVDDFVAQLPQLALSRAEVQRRRTVADRDVLPLIGEPIEPALPILRFITGHDALVKTFDVRAAFEAGGRVLVITDEPLTGKLAGPAIRAFHIASALAEVRETRLVSTSACSLTDDRVDCGLVRYADLAAEVELADVVIVQGFVMHHAPWLAATDRIIVVDLYDPIHVEQLEQTRGGPQLSRDRNIVSTTDLLNAQLDRGDYFLCASDAQRHFWLGQLAARGRLNVYTYDRDPSLRSLIDVVPFGLPDEPPATDRGALRGRVDGIGVDDKIVLWGGGLYDWFDPLTLIRAIRQVADTHDDIRLFFMGTAHPSPAVPEMSIVVRARRLSDELGLTDRHVFFNDGWIDYAARADYLLDADVGVSTHALHLETELSFRTRMLDYLWSGLPIVCTEGDTFAALVADRDLGRVVPQNDSAALATALIDALYDGAANARYRTNVAATRPEFTWSTALGPLVEFARSPRRAADSVLRGADVRAYRGSRDTGSGRWRGANVRERARHNAAIARILLTEGGPKLVARRAGARLAGYVGRGSRAR